MRLLESTLDSAELDRARRFRFESDRRAYVVAHGLRRVVLGDLLGVSPESLMLSKKASGEPQLIWPAESGIFFSHSHTREVVAFAASGVSKLGVDVELTVRSAPEFDLLARYVVLPESRQRRADLGGEATQQFFFYWTVLEAFWKASGKGLSPQHPRINCKKNAVGTFEIALEIASGRYSAPVATASRICGPDGCVISVVRQVGHQQADAGGAPAISATARPCKKSSFFPRTKRYQDSGFISMVSV